MFAYKVTRTQNFERDKKEYKKINMDYIRPNPYQPRKIFESEEILSLGESIKRYGLIQPITVRCVGENNYELIAGERRFRAARVIGLKEIDAFIIYAKKEQSALMALVENIQRQNLHFFEEAAAIEELIKEHDLTQEQVAIKLGKKQSTIANKLRILKLENEVRELIIKCGLTERHARALLKIEDVSCRLMAAEHIFEKNLNVKKSEEYIDELLNGHSKKLNKKINLSKFICDNRIYINSVKAVYKSIVEKGVKADFSMDELEEKIVLSISIIK